MEDNQRRSGFLLLLTGANFFLNYALGVLLARQLGVEHFDEFAVAVALVTMLSTLAELGAGKYAMRVLPVYAENEQWGHVRGYQRYARYAVLGASVLLVVAFALPGLTSSGLGPLGATATALLFLPALASVGYAAEVVQAHGATLRAAFLSRIVVPGTSLALVASCARWGVSLNASQGVVLFGLGWVAGLLLVNLFLAQTTPGPARRAEPVVMTPGVWLVDALPFLGFALLMVLMTKISLVVLRQVTVDEEVSVFAAALETGSFLYVVAKSTDKMFLPQIALALKRRDAAFLLRERRRRLAWMGGVCAVFLGAVVLFGREILGLYGEAFRSGYWPLVIVSAATAVWTLFSLSPSYLKYVDMKRRVIRGTAFAVLGVVVLTGILGARYGALGAAFGYAIPVATLYAVFSRTALGHLRAWMTSDAPDAIRDLEAEDRDEFSH